VRAHWACSGQLCSVGLGVNVARRARLVLPGHMHLVLVEARKGHPAVPDAQAAQALAHALAEHQRLSDVRVHAWSVLPAAWRLLCTPAQASSLAELVQGVGRRYVPWLHRHRSQGEGGSPWAGRFRSAPVDPQAFEVALLWAEACDPATPPWLGSAEHHQGRTLCPWLVEHEQHWRWGNTPFEREARHQALAQSGLSSAQQQSIASALKKGLPWGSVAFWTQWGESRGIAAQARPRGRPRKKTEPNSP
jgi:putative transposase